MLFWNGYTAYDRGLKKELSCKTKNNQCAISTSSKSLTPIMISIGVSNFQTLQDTLQVQELMCYSYSPVSRTGFKTGLYFSRLKFLSLNKRTTHGTQDGYRENFVLKCKYCPLSDNGRMSFSARVLPAARHRRLYFSLATVASCQQMLPFITQLQNNSNLIKNVFFFLQETINTVVNQ